MKKLGYIEFALDHDLAKNVGMYFLAILETFFANPFLW